MRRPADQKKGHDAAIHVFLLGKVSQIQPMFRQSKASDKKKPSAPAMPLDGREATTKMWQLHWQKSEATRDTQTMSLNGQKYGHGSELTEAVRTRNHYDCKSRNQWYLVVWNTRRAFLCRNDQS